MSILISPSINPSITGVPLYTHIPHKPFPINLVSVDSRWQGLGLAQGLNLSKPTIYFTGRDR